MARIVIAFVLIAFPLVLGFATYPNLPVSNFEFIGMVLIMPLIGVIVGASGRSK